MADGPSLLSLISMVWHRQVIFNKKETTELSRVKQKLELGRQSLWRASIQPTRCLLAFAPVQAISVSMNL